MECFAVASFVASHFMNGVMDSIQVSSLSSLSQVELACGSAVFGFDADSQVLLGGGGDDFAQQLCELGSVLSLFVGSLLPVQADFGIAFPVSDASHAQVHTDLGAFALEVGHQLLEDVLLVFLGDVGIALNGLCVNAVLMDSGQLLLALLLNELGCVSP